MSQGSPAKAVEIEGRKGPQLELLNGINGAFRPKVLTALMGVTGAGKTTLMDCLAGRKTSRHLPPPGASSQLSDSPVHQLNGRSLQGDCVLHRGHCCRRPFALPTCCMSQAMLLSPICCGWARYAHALCPHHVSFPCYASFGVDS